MLSHSMQKVLRSHSYAYLRASASARHPIFPHASTLSNFRQLSSASTAVVEGEGKAKESIAQRVEALLNKGKTFNPKKAQKSVIPGTSIPAPIDLLSGDNLKGLKISQIKEAIDSYAKNDNFFSAAIDALHKAKSNNLRIDGVYLAKGIGACAQGTRNQKALDIAFWAFETIKVDNAALLKPDSKHSTAIYEGLLSVCGRWYDMHRASALMKDFEQRGHTYTSYLLSTYIMLAASDGTPDDVQKILLPLYSTYKNLSKQRNFKITPKVFISVAARLCRMGHADQALTVLNDLTEVNPEPSAALCEPLLNAALSSSDTAVLRVLLTWYKTNFNMGLLNGQSNRILHIAASAGDGHLAVMAFQMLRDAGFEPTVSNYACVVRALLLSKDIISATEVLQEMERLGVAFTHTVTLPAGGTRTEFNANQYATIKTLLVEALVGSPDDHEGDKDKQFYMGKQLMDTLYTALAEQVRAARSAEAAQGEDSVPAPIAVVPRIVLDALVEASGNLGMADRAFAIFQEYSNLFDVTPDIHSYNSLLTACAVQRKVNMNAIFTVFQELEASCPPSEHVEEVQAGSEQEGEGAPAAVPVSKANGQSFTILLEAMTACRELKVFEQVFDHMLASGVVATPQALRDVAVALALSGQHWRSVERVKEVLIAQRLGMHPRDMTSEKIAARLSSPQQGAGPSSRDNKKHLLPVSFERRLAAIKEGQVRAALISPTFK